MAKLVEASPALHRLLVRGDLEPARFDVGEITCSKTLVTMRDGKRLAADLYLPPTIPAPAVVTLTPYGRGADQLAGTLLAFARRGHAVLSVDCRGTGSSEPEAWDYYMFESEDGFDVIQWVTQQSWFGGFVGSCGGSYAGQTQWCMATHPAMSAIAPQVSGLGVAVNTAHIYMLLNAYARSVGKGEDKIAVPLHEMEKTCEQETMAGGYYNEPLVPEFPASILRTFPNLRDLSTSEVRKRLWAHYASLPSRARAQFVRDLRGSPNVTAVDVEALSGFFGQQISHDRHSLPHASAAELCKQIHAAPLLITGWYDWGLNDALATWQLLRRHADAPVAERARLIIGPHAHDRPGYLEGIRANPELGRIPNTAGFTALLMHWYRAVREGDVPGWPRVAYYLMGANEWRVADDWPVPEARPCVFFLSANGALSDQPPCQGSDSDSYVYDPADPTPTVGGSIVSYLYTPGSVDVGTVQQRADVLTYTTPAFERDLDVVGPVQLVLYASSSARDTDFVARLSDVFPDGRAIQLQSSILRARFRNPAAEPELLTPGQSYRFEIDIWATANRFKAGHCLRLDISSADFPRFDRNSNRGGEPGDPILARQTIYRDPDRPSQLTIPVLQ